MNVAQTTPLNAAHDVDHFDCGVKSLNDWLRLRGSANQASGASRVFVAETEGRVAGYYALAAGSITLIEATGRFRRSMPDPAPVVVLGRLAVDTAYAGRGVGRALVADAVRRMLSAAEVVGVRGMLIHARDERAAEFYRRLGFASSGLRPLTLMATVADLQANL